MEKISFAGRDWNEDYAFAGDKFWFVLDGATSLMPEKYSNEETDAKWFSHRFGMFLETALADNSKSIAEIVKEGIDIVVGEYKVLANGRKIVDMPSACIAIIRENNGKMEYFVLGDCGFLMKRNGKVKDYTDERLPSLDKINIDDMVKFAKQKNINVIDAKKYIKEDNLKKRLSKNTVGGYWVLCDSKEACDHAVQGEILLKSGDGFLLYSDGFSQIWDTFYIMSTRDVFEFIESGHGLTDLYKILFDAQENDSGCNKHPRMKMRDDSTAIYLKK